MSTNKATKNETETLTSMYAQLEKMRAEHSRYNEQISSDLKEWQREMRHCEDDRFIELSKKWDDGWRESLEMTERQQEIVNATRHIANLIGGETKDNFDYFTLVK